MFCDTEIYEQRRKMQQITVLKIGGSCNEGAAVYCFDALLLVVYLKREREREGETERARAGKFIQS